MRELERKDILDLSSCGVAAYSAATIHRMKTELLLKADKPRQPGGEKPGKLLVVPPPADLPCMPEFMVATIGELIQALRSVFSKRGRGSGGEEDKVLLEVFDVRLDEFLVRIEERLEEFLEGLRRIFDGKEFVDVREVFRGADRVEAARRFILLLFAAAKGYVEIVEDEELRVIAVKWNGGAGGA
ncbi:MAG TPA: hypothetical protein ENG52_03155 [Nitrososphaeria archaeon]|nr:hypothetical protein [Nitrososphaeria archaeon]